MPLTTQAEPEHRFSGAYDPDKYRHLEEQPPKETCECGLTHYSFIYEFQGQKLCLNCALDAAGIERRLVRP